MSRLIKSMLYLFPLLGLSLLPEVQASTELDKGIPFG